jgi:hypothetical protein
MALTHLLHFFRTAPYSGKTSLGRSLGESLHAEHVPVVRLAYSRLDAHKLGGCTFHRYLGADLNEHLWFSEASVQRAAAKMRTGVHILDCNEKTAPKMMELLDQAGRRKTGVDAQYGGLPIILMVESSTAASAQK